MAKVSMDVFTSCVDAEKREGRPAKVFKWDAKVPLYLFLELENPVNGYKREVIFDSKVVGFGDTKVEACVSSVRYAYECGMKLVKLVNSGNFSEDEVRNIFNHKDAHSIGSLITYYELKLKEAKNA